MVPGLVLGSSRALLEYWHAMASPYDLELIRHIDDLTFLPAALIITGLSGPKNVNLGVNCAIMDVLPLPDDTDHVTLDSLIQSQLKAGGAGSCWSRDQVRTAYFDSWAHDDPNFHVIPASPTTRNTLSFSL